MAHRLSPRASSDLDDIWNYRADESGNERIADRFIDTLTERFVMLARTPHLGRRRDELLRGCAVTRSTLT